MKTDYSNKIISLLESQGFQPVACDVPVPQYDNYVRCGLPTDMGDPDQCDWWMIPKSLARQHPCIILTARGDSMQDAGYRDGDLLRIELTDNVSDGDDVLVWVDGECTVKTLFTDAEDNSWLVPRNDKYDAIPLTDYTDVRFLGRVAGIEKAPQRASSRNLLQAIRRTKNKRGTLSKLPTQDVDNHITAIAPLIAHARQWFAVYRPLRDHQLVDKGDFEGFCQRVRRLLPDHQHLPVVKEIQRMNVQSFAKPLPLWNEQNAPVKGKWFYDYQRIALKMNELLTP